MESNRVYLIDDDEGCRKSLTFLLNASGFNCEPFESATDFFSAVPQNAQGVVLADHRLRDGNAVAILQALREAGQQIPVVVLSGRIEPEVAALAREHGAAGLLHKPVPADELIKLLNEVIGGPVDQSSG